MLPAADGESETTVHDKTLTADDDMRMLGPAVTRGSSSPGQAVKQRVEEARKGLLAVDGESGTKVHGRWVDMSAR